jgi:hypothetical protein
MPTSKGKQRLPTSGFLGQVRADENGNGVAKRTAGEKNKKVMRLKELRVLLEKKVSVDCINHWTWQDLTRDHFANSCSFFLLPAQV